jgi:hypothetical protein
LDEK